MGISRRSTMVDRWMPLYPEAYLRDTAHLSAEEHGAYLLLLMQAWLNDGVLPTEDSALRRIARMDEKPWKKSRKTIMSFFVLTVEGFHNIRVDFELNKAKENVAKKVSAGRASGEARRAGKERYEMMQTVDTFVEHEIISGGDKGEHLFNTCSTPVPVLLTKNTEKHEHNTNPYTYIHGAPVGPPILQPEAVASLTPAGAVVCEDHGGKTKAITKKKAAPDSAETWEAYAKAYTARYGTPPVRNARVNSQMASFIRCVGTEEAPIIAAWFLRHRGQWYNTQMHSVACLAKDAEKLSTECRTGHMQTATKAREADRLAEQGAVWEKLLAEADNADSSTIQPGKTGEK